MTATPTRRIDQFTLTRDLAVGARALVARSTLPILLICLVLAGYLMAMGRPGGLALAAMGIGTSLVFATWRHHGISVPLLPLLALQQLLVYGVPIAITNATVLLYPESLVTHAGWEVLAFSVALAGGWKFGMQMFAPSPPVAYTLRLLTLEGHAGLRRAGYFLLFFLTAYNLAQSLDLLVPILAALPSGTESLATALVSVAGICGFFVIALEIGSGKATLPNRLTFWSLFAANCLVSAAGLLLSSTTGYIAATTIGLFWGSQRVPWRFLAVVLALLGFLSVGKYEMRNRYWEVSEDFIPNVALKDIPARYSEWADVSLKVLMNVDPRPEQEQTRDNTDGSLLARIDNLQNILYVMDEVQEHHTPLLHGATYTLIPPLLIPRIFWPDKPRAHEGQVMLNVHFGRQDLLASYRTYIAWGLLPEAFGNFGPWFGAILLGAVLGILCAWFENLFTNKPVLSMEGFVAFTIFLGVAASFEMVASVLVTSIFQGVLAVIAACVPFVHREKVVRPVR